MYLTTIPVLKRLKGKNCEFKSIPGQPIVNKEKIN